LKLSKQHYRKNGTEDLPKDRRDIDEFGNEIKTKTTKTISFEAITLQKLNFKLKKMSKNIILTNQEIEHKIKRIAYQIYETFVDEKRFLPE
jgi:glucosamine 6-phosphate synthetase-like amidotransferase/phosphosugar isomerase protein